MVEEWEWFEDEECEGIDDFCDDFCGDDEYCFEKCMEVHGC